MSQDPNAIEAQLKAASTGQKGLPPVDQWHPELSGDIDIRIARDGNWFYKGEVMARRALTNLFSTIMRREDDNQYYLVTPVEKWRIEVEDTPLQAHSLTAVGKDEKQELYLTTSAEEILLIGKLHPLVVGTYSGSDEPRPVVYVRNGLEARLMTSAFYDLADYVVENPNGSANNFGVWSDGEFFEIGQGA